MIIVKVNYIQTKKTIEKIYETRSCFFEKIHKTEKTFNHTHQEKENPTK